MSWIATLVDPGFWRPLKPKLATTLTEGYGWSRLRADAIAGLTVAIVALPLAMAIAIGSGVTPDRGLTTAVVGGFLISALGGSRFQIGGPAAAFIVIVVGIAHVHGDAGLLTAMFLAGFVLIGAALLKLGAWVKYVPGPVILGFTSGIGVLILVGQIKDFCGLKGNVPADVIGRILALIANSSSFAPPSFLAGAATLALIVGLKKWRPNWPALLIAVVGVSGLTTLTGFPVETIGTRFGGLAASLPSPSLPDLSWHRITEMLPSAFTIAFLVAVESLLSAVAADTMGGSRHRSNAEVMAQGVANIASSLFGGLPVTGVIARTGTNIAAGGTSPVAGMLHAIFVLLAMVLLAPLAKYMALPCLAAVLVNVAWRLIDWRELVHFSWSAPSDDRLVLLATLGLTILVDLNVAIAVGVGLAAMLFVHRMSELPGVHLGDRAMLDEDESDVEETMTPVAAPIVPDGVRVIQLRGPLFFGAAATVAATFRQLDHWPDILILRMGHVPLIDATAVSVLEELAAQCRKHGNTRLIICGLQAQPRAALEGFGFLKDNDVALADDLPGALADAKRRLTPESALMSAAGR